MFLENANMLLMEHIVSISIAVVSAFGWFQNKTNNRINRLEERFERVAVEYVQKPDHVRELSAIHAECDAINNKLDKLMEKVFTL